MKNLTNFSKIKRTIQQLQFCYENCKIEKYTILKCLENEDFQSKYVNY